MVTPIMSMYDFEFIYEWGEAVVRDYYSPNGTTKNIKDAIKNINLIKIEPGTDVALIKEVPKFLNIINDKSIDIKDKIISHH